MEVRDRTWAEVKKGSFVLSKKGVTWKVVRENSTHFGLQNRCGETEILPKPAGHLPAKIFYLTEAELVAMLVEQLGAELTDFKETGSNIFISRPWGEMKIQEMKSHLFLMHGVSAKSVNDPGNPAGMNSKKALTECHDHHHVKPGDRWTPHVHDEDGLHQWPADQ